MDLSMDEPEDIDFTIRETEERLLSKLIGLADHLVNNFFLPLKASTKRLLSRPRHTTPRSKAREPETSRLWEPQSDRLSTLRGNCLLRDKHRCVISRSFDRRKAVERMREFGDEAQDDDGQPLTGESFDSLEVAHILPHSLLKTNSDSKLDASREAALHILNMLDNDVAHLIEGPDIDRPRNALTLTHNLHQDFGDFQIYFEPTGISNTYRIHTFLPAAIHSFLPITRGLFLAEDRTIEPPSPRLLAIHRAIAHILQFSAAGRYIDRVLQDLEEQTTNGPISEVALVHLVLFFFIMPSLIRMISRYFKPANQILNLGAVKISLPLLFTGSLFLAFATNSVFSYDLSDLNDALHRHEPR
ncbi:hypothetical protein NOR_07103 [Metarhizium rileyi]|uniref:HNH nuclease domain-containing protein n=1 Tax=Metarhizium rileyi (strain RCEF 4871) TaxID=1649241 RepID=A0A166Z082_METRR|nr:hypothetical protein NOR_07103 [Metarhizium rileyi RCEF 4871]